MPQTNVFPKGKGLGINKEQLLAFTGIHFFMGTRILPSITNCWSILENLLVPYMLETIHSHYIWTIILAYQKIIMIVSVKYAENKKYLQTKLWDLKGWVTLLLSVPLVVHGYTRRYFMLIESNKNIHTLHRWDRLFEASKRGHRVIGRTLCSVRNTNELISLLNTGAEKLIFDDIIYKIVTVFPLLPILPGQFPQVYKWMHAVAILKLTLSTLS